MIFAVFPGSVNRGGEERILAYSLVLGVEEKNVYLFVVNGFVLLKKALLCEVPFCVMEWSGYLR
ncbi:MAG: hypothetical protein IJM26_05830 [Lachnospiraceae bacterium]|nr:hypothetical protein [Lachnospiraceae bacterium]